MCNVCFSNGEELLNKTFFSLNAFRVYLSRDYHPATFCIPNVSVVTDSCFTSYTSLDPVGVAGGRLPWKSPTRVVSIIVLLPRSFVSPKGAVLLKEDFFLANSSLNSRMLAFCSRRLSSFFFFFFFMTTKYEFCKLRQIQFYKCFIQPWMSTVFNLNVGKKTSSSGSLLLHFQATRYF